MVGGYGGTAECGIDAPIIVEFMPFDFAPLKMYDVEKLINQCLNIVCFFCVLARYFILFTAFMSFCIFF